MQSLEFLEEGINRLKNLRVKSDALNDALKGIDSEFNYFTPGFITSDYLWFLSQAFNDTSDWIGYFIYECELGKKPFEVEFTNPGKKAKFKMKNVKTLYEVMKFDYETESC
jgi:hypothetical protein